MKTIKLFVLFIMALSIVSCSKSKEDQFIDDVENFVVTFEQSSLDDLKENFEASVKTFYSRVENLYGVDLNKADHIVECAESSGLNLNEEQKKKLFDLEERLLKKLGDVKKEAKEGKSSNDDKEDETESSISSSDSEDWDELLESYEGYVDQYISLMKKASNGDIDALSEYPALLEKAQKFTDKMKNAEEQMSASQWAKYNEITQKMLKAAQEMNE
jgi:hypothetical protein